MTMATGNSAYRDRKFRFASLGSQRQPLGIAGNDRGLSLLALFPATAGMERNGSNAILVAQECLVCVKTESVVTRVFEPAGDRACACWN